MLIFNLITLSMLISNQQQSWAVSLALWSFLGLIVGFITGKIFNESGYGLARDCLFGVAGAVVGGLLANLGGKFSGSGLELYSEFVVVAGAVVFMFFDHALRRWRGFLR